MNTPITEPTWVSAVVTWISVLLAVSAGGYVLAGLLAARTRGSLIDGFVGAAKGALDLPRDLMALSFRRLWAIAYHSILESIRRRLLLAVFGVLIVIFMFGGWFLPSRPTEQVKVYVSFVLLASTLIVLPAGGLLACLSLPSDIQDKTIHTVVTKPVRRLEIIIGRILGLTVVATAILTVMGAMSYIYMRRSVDGSLAELRQKMGEAKQQGDVKHETELKDSLDQIENKLIARVPVYGYDLTGPVINVGYETTYRYYIAGNSTDAAVWKFRDVPTSRLLALKSIPLEMTFSVFRTTKGQVGRGVLAQITYANPKTERMITDYPFEVREYYVDKQSLDNRPDAGRTYAEGEKILPEPPADPLSWLLDKSDGEMTIIVRCLSSSQYLGMARPDLYILIDTANFGLNFAKGVVGVWLRVFLIVSVAVMFSTFLSGYVAMLATAAVFAGGLCMNYLRGLAAGKSEGGGPFEALQRLIKHENLQRPLDPGIWTDLTKGVDGALQFILQGLTYVLPDLGVFNTGPLVANGFDIGIGVLLVNLVTALGYVIPFTIAGYFFLQSREIAR